MRTSTLFGLMVAVVLVIVIHAFVAHGPGTETVASADSPATPLVIQRLTAPRPLMAGGTDVIDIPNQPPPDGGLDQSAVVP